MSSLKDDLKSFRRSWVHHTGMQLATLTVLAATFSVVAFVLSLSLNFSRILASWGDGVQLTVYLHDDVADDAVIKLKTGLSDLDLFKEIVYVPRETATLNFKTQMASYAPDLLADADFSNPFPSSFRLSLKGGVATEQDVNKIENIAATIQKMPGVEDVSYGQSWVRNYSSFVTTLYAAGGVMGLILLVGSLFVVGNSIRTSIAVRREEIEILELVGATSMMIRRPFVVEGLATGALAALVALALNLGLHVWEKSVMSSSLVLARLVPMMNFLEPLLIVAFIVAGALLGAVGAWLSIRRINDGWSAKQTLEA
jgi:cell division transport system permease protein